ncbi:hypothetical protein [Pectobacterium brasiliense]|uniref:hypothetical protein n=1 Tax=Pectobacterium brasiliense TaxID=180957 RepID=UPI001969053E|nr:hypothetical protein [Pectobacterium brasiliense]MBN3262971.1 hypothetical protein [Pectobacterium brasiliense]
MLNAEVSIITPTVIYVKQLEAKNEIARKQTRIIRAQIADNEIGPEMRKLGNSIVRCQQNGQRVRIPALQSNEWGQVLRAIELTKSYY